MKETLKLFWTFFKIGCFTFGGGYAMILMIKREITDKNKWVDDKEFLNYLSLAQASPGPMAVNTAILIGYKQKKALGGLAGFFGSTLPSFIILLTIAIFFKDIYELDVTKRVFMGLRPAVVALILYPVFEFAKNVTRKEYPIFILVGVAIYYSISPIYFIIGAIIYGVIYTFRVGRKEVK